MNTFNFQKHNKLIPAVFLAAFFPIANLIAIPVFKTADINSYMLFALLFIFIINPVMIILSVYFKKSSQLVITASAINFFFWVILLAPAVNLNFKKNQKLEIEYLKTYDPLIETIYQYKAKNNTFPDNDEQLKNIDKTHLPYTYEKTNQDFVLTLEYANFIQYKYCSDISSASCALFKTDSFESTRVEKWTKIEEID